MAVLAVALTALAWMQQPDPLSARDAVSVARSAFAAAGVDATVDPRPGRGRYEPVADDPVPVWQVEAALAAGTVDLWVARDDGQPVFIDDRTDDGTGQLLTDVEVTAVGDHRSNPPLGRQVRRNLLVTAAALLIVVVALRVALVSSRPTPQLSEESIAR